MTFLFGIWILVFGISSLGAVPVYTDTTYPKISVTDTAEYYKVTINDLEGDSLFDIGYSWGVKPHVYASVAVANDDTANWQFSVRESLRWEYIQKKTVQRWDKATYNKHPMDFMFLKYPLIIDHSKQELLNTNYGRYVIWCINKFQVNYSGSIVTPYIYIYIDGGNYYTSQVGISSINWGSNASWLGGTYLGYFNDASPGRSDTTFPEYLDEVAIHELNHYFVRLPQIQPYFDNLSHYAHVTALNSPNGQDGDFEAYDPLCDYVSSWGYMTDEYCAPLSQICMGIRSKYEDSSLTLYGGYYQNKIFHDQWNYYMDTTSSKYFYEQSDQDYWALHICSNKINLADSTREFLLPKSEQQNRSLLVYASDTLHPGYFKCFSLGAQSEVTVIDNPTIGISGQCTVNKEGLALSLTVRPNPFRDQVYISTWSSTVNVFNLQGKLIRKLSGNKNTSTWDGIDGNGVRVKAGVYILKLQQNGKEYSTSVMFLR